MSKRQDEFLDHFARLGVFSKVQTLMRTGCDNEVDIIKSQNEAKTSEKGKFFKRNFANAKTFNLFIFFYF